jgi:hypothetical protein
LSIDGPVKGSFIYFSPLYLYVYQMGYVRTFLDTRTYIC